MKVIKYKLSGDRKGLLAYYANNDFFHIHSDELFPEEKIILDKLKAKKDNKMKILRRFLKNKMIELWEIRFFNWLGEIILTIGVIWACRYLPFVHQNLDYNKTKNYVAGWILSALSITVTVTIIVLLKFTIEWIKNSIKYNLIPWIRNNWDRAKIEIEQENKK